MNYKFLDKVVNQIVKDKKFDPSLNESEANIITHPEDDEDPYSFDWHPEPNKRKFYEAVLRDVVNDSTIEPDGVISVGDTEVSNQRGLLFHNLSHSYDVGPFLKHLRETYGLLRAETHPIWTRWEHIMTHKIKKWLTAKGIKLSDAGYEEPLWVQNDEEEINESTKPLPDRIFQMIQDDLFNRTVKIPTTNRPLCTGGESVDYRDFDDPVDVGANQEGVYDQPNFVIQLNLPSSEFPYNVEMGRKRSWGQLNDYLTQQYGLTQEECERVWDEYRGTICKNAKLPFVNESVDFSYTDDKDFPFLNKLANHTMSITEIGRNAVMFPFIEGYISDGNFYKYFHGTPYDQLPFEATIKMDGYLKDFGLTENEKEIWWDIYAIKVIDAINERDLRIIDSHGELYESTESNFLDKVVTHLLKDTKYDKQSDMIVSPIPIEGRAIRSSLNFTIYHKFLWDLKDYLNKIYGLNEEEADEVWGKYQRKLRIYNAYDNAYSLIDDIISESIDKKKVKQQKVLDYAIEDLTNNTLLDWGSDTEYPYQIIRFPFSIYPNKDPRKNPLKKNRLEWIMIDRKYNLDITQFYDQFKTHAQTMYGLTDVELLKVFADWEGEVIEKIRDHSETDPPGYINESTDKQEKYLQYIITTLLNETIIDKENEEVHLPWGMMYVNVFSNFAAIDVDLHNPAKDLTGNISENFWDMMEKIYGLRGNEVERVWKIYGPTLSKKMHVAWFDDWIELMSRI